MILISDTRQQDGKHTQKELYWKKHGIEIVEAPLPFGDYILGTEEVMEVIRYNEEHKTKLEKMDFIGSFNVIVDTKKDIQELVQNLCGKDHYRAEKNYILARKNGIKLYVLVQNVGGAVAKDSPIRNETIRKLEDLHEWKNPRLFEMKNTNEVIGTHKNGKPKYRKIQKFPSATRGVTLMKVCMTMQKKYGVEFVFCHNSEQGAKVLELLQREVK